MTMISLDVLENRLLAVRNNRADSGMDTHEETNAYNEVLDIINQFRVDETLKMSSEESDVVDTDMTVEERHMLWDMIWDSVVCDGFGTHNRYDNKAHDYVNELIRQRTKNVQTNKLKP